MAYAANLTAHKADLYGVHGTFNYSDENIAPILRLLDAAPGERILDLGCGDGALTDKLINIVGEGGSVLGTDSNAGMLAKAEERYSRLRGKVFQSDAQALEFPQGANYENSFDVVFSNATLHWCKRDPPAVLDGVKRALKKSHAQTSTGRPPRFVAEFGGFLNCVGVRSHIHNILKERGIDPVPLDPWFFPTDTEYKDLLESKGFKVEHISLNPRITHLNTDLYGWLQTFARYSFLSAMTDEEAESILREVVRRAELDTRPQSLLGQPTENTAGQWSVMYVRIRLVASL